MTGAARAGLAAAGAAFLLLAGCRRAPSAGSAATGSDGGTTAEAPAEQAAADSLGLEVFELVDRAADFRSARHRTPDSLRELGLDSLTPRTVRRLEVVNGEARLIVAYRDDRHPVGACSGDSQVLEDASLQEGRFSVLCTRADGSEATFLVTPPKQGKRRS